MRLKQYLQEMKITRPRPGLFRVESNGIEYEISYEPSDFYDKSKPWKLGEYEFKGAKLEPIARFKTKKEALKQIQLIK